MTIIHRELGECDECNTKFWYHNNVSTYSGIVEAAGQTIEEFYEEGETDKCCPECGSRTFTYLKRLNFLTPENMTLFQWLHRRPTEDEL